MESNLNVSLLFLLAAAGFAAWYSVGYFYAPRLSPKEPPLLDHPIPYIGHILGLLRHGTRYYEITRSVTLLLSMASEMYSDDSPNAVQSANFPSTL